MESHDVDRLTRELALRKRLQDALLVFSKSISARLTLETALESLVLEVGAILGVRRTSVWLHDRQARILILSASSDPRDKASTARIPTSESSAIARGLRVDVPEVSGEGDAQCLAMSLRGWRRALGTLVIEGRAARLDPELFVELSADLARHLGAALERVLVLEDHLRDAAAQAELRVRLAQVVANLLVFTGRQPATRETLQLQDLLAHTVALRETAPNRAPTRIVHKSSPQMRCVLGDRVRLQQALLNIIINAEQAIAESGTPGDIALSTRSEGPSVIIEIENTGPEIPPDILPRIFEPFFTTKDVGQGTGLGLAIAYGIVQDHGGAITASSSPRRTAFTIVLPVSGDRVTTTGLF